MTSPIDSASAFAALGLSSPLLSTLDTLGYEEPTPIQQMAIPALLSGRDLLGQAATGTGKTAAFALPLLERIASTVGQEGGPRSEVRALVLVPTRELAIQVAEAIHKYGKQLGVHVLPIYGGQAMQLQLRALSRGVDVVVATPGRVLDHLRRKTLDLKHVLTVVLDEADEMLDMGFAEDLEAILNALPEERQTALFSATIPRKIAVLAERHLHDPERITIAREQLAAGEVPLVRQLVYLVHRREKVAALGRVLDMENPTSAIVFCRTRTEVDELTETLGAHGYRADALHGGMSQDQRSRVMKRFREGASELLIATDVAARGLDIGHLSHVVNFDVPSAPDAYVHRIGRTGRAGREGTAVTLAEPRERRLLRNIEQHTGQRMKVETVPTVMDLQARRILLTSAAVRDAVLAGNLEQFTVVVESLSDDFELMDIAAAAVKVAHESSAGKDTGPDITPVVDRAESFEGRKGARGAPRERGASRKRDAGADFAAPPAREREARRFDRDANDGDAGPPRRKASRGDFKSSRVFVGIGREGGVRPNDLVGAIANEAGIDARSIGTIEIAENFSLVDIKNDLVDQVIAAMRTATVLGQRVPVRRESEEERAIGGAGARPAKTAGYAKKGKPFNDKKPFKAGKSFKAGKGFKGVKRAAGSKRGKDSGDFFAARESGGGGKFRKAGKPVKGRKKF